MAWNEPGNNGRDPWGGGNRNDQGPPDLDEVVKDLGTDVIRQVGVTRLLEAGKNFFLAIFTL